MKLNMKKIFFLTTLLILIIGLTTLSAVESSDITQDTSSDVDTVSVTPDNSVNIEKTTTKTVEKKTEQKTIKKEVQTHVINNDTIDNYFVGSNYGLNDDVSEGDILDFQGNIFRSHSIRFNKAVNVTSSTKDAVVCLNTTSGSLMGDAPGNSFIIDHNGSYSNFTGIYLNNTQFWVTNASHVTFTNMSMVVNDSRVGSGVGQTSIRDGSEYITLRNCFIYTRNNGGSSSFVIAGAGLCTLDNNTIMAEGNVGNLVYLTTYNTGNNRYVNAYNNITNNKIYGPATASAISWGITLTGHSNLVENNTINYVGNGLVEQWGSGTSIWDEPGKPVEGNKYIGNTFNRGCGITGRFTNCTVINNTINDGGNFNIYANYVVDGNTVTGNTTINNPVNLSNHKLHNVKISSSSASNTNITNNIIDGVIDITGSSCSGITIANNEIKNDQNYTINMKGRNSYIYNNTLLAGSLAGEDTIIDSSNNNLIENNTPESGDSIIITDETYADYFDENGNIKLDTVGNYSKIYFTGKIYDKTFKFNDIITNLYNNQSTLYNSTIELNDNTKIAVVALTIKNTDKTALIVNSPDTIIRQNTIYAYTTGSCDEIIIINSDKTTFDNNKIYYNQTGDTNNTVTTILINSENNTITSNTIQIANHNESQVEPEIEPAIINGIVYPNVIQNTEIKNSSFWENNTYINNSTLNCVNDWGIYFYNNSVINNSVTYGQYYVDQYGAHTTLYILNSTLYGTLYIINEPYVYIDDSVTIGENFTIDVSMIGDNAKIITNNTVLKEKMNGKTITIEDINDENRFMIDESSTVIPKVPVNDPANDPTEEEVISVDNLVFDINGANNYIYNNNIKVNTTGEILTADIKADNTRFIKNTINLITTGEVTAIIIESNTDKVNTSQNTITITTPEEANGIIIPDNTTQASIQSNTMTITTDEKAVGILVTGTGIENIDLTSNTMKATSELASGIIVDSTDDENRINNININSNTVHAAGVVAVGVLINADNVVMKNTINVTKVAPASTDEEEETQGNEAENGKINLDSITVALLILDSQNITQTSSYTDIYTNHFGAVIVNTDYSSFNYLRTRTVTEETPVIIINSTNNKVTNCEFNTTDEYAIILINSSDSNITNNKLKSATFTGDDAVYLDENSKNDDVRANSITIRTLTDETYDQLFDENHTLIKPLNTLIIGDDIHNKVLRFTSILTLSNPDSHTLYNTSIIIEDAGSLFDMTNIKINNTCDDTTAITAINSGIKLITSSIYIEGNNNKALLLDTWRSNNARITSNNITVTGDNNVIIDVNNYILNNGFQYNNFDTVGENNTIAIFKNAPRNDVMMQNNNMTQNSITPTTAIIVDNSSTYIRQNRIVTNTTQEETPLIIVANITSDIGQVSNNYLETLDVVGDDCVDSEGQVNGNTPQSPRKYLNLTDDNYNEYFDDDAVLINKYKNYIIVFASNIYNKDMNFPTYVEIQGNGYTLYNGTVNIYNASETLNITGLNINNTDDRESAFIMTNSRINMRNSNIYQSGNNKIAVILNSTGSGYNGATFDYNNITVDGDNNIAFYMNAIRPVNSAGYISYNIIKMNGTDNTATYIDSTRPNGMYAVFDQNNITMYSESPVTAAIINNVQAYYDNNNIVTNTLQGEIPIVKVIEATNGRVNNNYIESLDLTGQAAVDTPGTKTGNTPNDGTGYKVKINVDKDELSQYKTGVITFNVTDMYDELLEGVTSVTLNGEEVILTDNQIEYTPLTADDITLKITYTDPEGKYATTTLTKTITVKEINTTITVEPINMSIGEVTTITASVVDQDGEAITGGRVYFKVNGKVLRNTDNKVVYIDVADGTASIDINDTSAWTNKTKVQAFFVGTATTKSASSEVVNPTIKESEEDEPVFSVADVTASAGDEITVTVTTKNLDDGKVVLKVNGKTVKNSEGKLYTKVAGDSTVFTYKLPATIVKGEYSIKAVYTSGSDKYEAESTLTIE